MADPTGKASGNALRLDFAPCVKLQFHGAVITSAAGVLAYRAGCHVWVERMR
jgi:hypothetical protein